MAKSLKGRSLLCLKDFTKEELEEFIFQGEKLKIDYYAGKKEKLLDGKTIAVLFEKPSTRTRISFAVAIHELGAFPLILETSNLQLVRGETVPDTAKVMGRMVQGIVARVFAQKTLEELAEFSGVPVINALSDFSHPCQALGDFLTIKEKKGKLQGIKLTYLGDGNNVANSLLIGGSILGLDVSLGCPKGFEPAKEVIDMALHFAKKSGSKIEITNDPAEAAKNADVLYTDVWASMGQEAEHDKRVAIMKPYQINSSILSHAKEDAIVMHCLPAHRGEEITDEVLDGPHSVVFDQAENRLHIQKAILSLLI
ncbi:ornithine carbamoyltransferase [Caldisericum exile]|uniref:Ornithine carbamoyltransferase n=1 Tax=Caldisericum exile (strain DSM 21853 / NBRC 104410 / AZM16c01) TaxID=511051 RepID=A0A7U6JF47_CALEA|nr:ornithine carbamoyltransferase [Caldisericum exile]BAL81093.1 ornithine carbamoyltransferase [Caldisericum exile AZM16c01]